MLLKSVRGFSSRASRLKEDIPTLQQFMNKRSPSSPMEDEEVLPPYLTSAHLDGGGDGVYMETYGCQMNVADTEVVRAVLKGANYAHATAVAEAEVVLLNTCAIRENAEAKIWNRLKQIRSEKRKAAADWRKRGLASRPSGPVVGLLGCMGERLKGKLLEEEKLVDIVCGPDAYRSLPRLIAQARAGEQALDVALSLDETYADVAPVRENSDGISAFVSIMRGCNNMCSYCIVPHTRGRERSRPALSIAAEVAQLVQDGFAEITLLGQNVNSYADGSRESGHVEEAPPLRDGFSPMVPPPKASLRFAGLLDGLAAAHPEVRFRFTSPHPKDFPDDLLEVIRDRPNACASLHIPAQSGSSQVLQSMRRGYSRDTYLALIDRVRELLPHASLSSDFISGFCGETEADHEATLSLMQAVRFDKAFMFAYSMREKTHAHRRLVDDVPEDVKSRRLQAVIETFTAGAKAANMEEIGRHHLVLVEGASKKPRPDGTVEWMGRTDTNKRVVLEHRPLRTVGGEGATASTAHGGAGDNPALPLPGTYVAVRVTEALSANTLRAEPLAMTSIRHFASAESRGHENCWQ